MPCCEKSPDFNTAIVGLSMPGDWRIAIAWEMASRRRMVDHRAGRWDVRARSLLRRLRVLARWFDTCRRRIVF